MMLKTAVQSRVWCMKAALKQAYNVEVSEQEAATITTRLVSLIKLLDQMAKEQNQEVSVC